MTASPATQAPRASDTLRPAASDTHRTGVPFFVPAAAFLLYFVRFGYGYGTSDQDEVIPYLLHRLDPGLFARDWFVQAQVETFNIRSYFVWLLQPFAEVLPVWSTVLLAYVTVWLVLAGAVYALARRLTSDELAAAAAVVCVLVLTPQWTLGGNDLVHAMLVPSMVAWAAALWGIVLLLDDRILWAGALIGVSTWMQALVGLHVAGLLCVAMVLRALAEGRFPNVWKSVLVFAAVFVVSALPALGPLFFQQFTSIGAEPPNGAPSLFYLMARFRNPHHYLPLSFPADAYIRFGILAVLGSASGAYLRRSGSLHHDSLVRGLLVAVALFCAVGVLGTEVAPVLLIAKLQLFKSTVVAKVLFVVCCCGAVAAVLPHGPRRWFAAVLRHRGRSTVAVAAAALVVGAATVPASAPLHERVGPWSQGDAPAYRISEWARVQTPSDAMFAVPPSWSGFRTYAQRAIVIDFKAFPYRDALIYEWYERLTSMAPIEPPRRATQALQERLDAAFAAQPCGRLIRKARRYGADYAVCSPASGRTDAYRVFDAGTWTVYRVRGEER